MHGQQNIKIDLRNIKLTWDSDFGMSINLGSSVLLTDFVTS